MKKIYLLRHAKSDWSDPVCADFDRPLNMRGLRDAPFMAKKLAGNEYSIQLILSSPANRAITTAQFFAEALKIGASALQIEEKIYDASVKDLIQIICSLSESYSTVLIVGHNPGMSLLAAYLTNSQMDMPTCAIACIELEIETWNMTSKATGSIVSFDYPKKYFNSDLLH
ncbi:MAG: SixA phosphatase family protein [Flavobacteriales bacterium]